MLINNVPFTPQDPTAKWTDIRLKSGCEEASVYMVMKWIRGETIINNDQATKDLITLADFAFSYDSTNEHHDFSVYDIVNIMLKDYYKYDQAEIVTDFNINDLINILEAGKIIITPTYGRSLGNPHFTAPGPEQHMVVITGYDADEHEFITNDPGTKYGQNYRYDENILYQAIKFYSTGPGSEFPGGKAIILITK